MNLGQIRRRVGLALNVAGGGTTTGDELTLLDEYANEAVEQILLQTKVNKKTAEVALTAGKGDYTLDPLMLAFDDIWIEPTPDTGYQPMLEYVDSYDIRAMRNAATPATASPPSYISYEGNVIMLYPNPASGDKMHIVYVPRPTAMSDASHDPSLAPYGEIPAEFHHLIESYTKWKMADYADDASSQVGATYQAAFERGILAMKVTLTKKAGVRIGHARVGRRRTTRLTPPGVDVRG